MRSRVWALLSLACWATLARGSFVTAPSPAWPTIGGDTAHESVRDLNGPTTWQLPMGGTVDGVSCRSDKLDAFYRQTWQPNVEAVITNTGTTPVINPRLVVNGKRDWRTLQAMVSEATAGCTTSAEKARGIWEFVRRNVVHSLAGNDFHAWQILNSYGYSLCDGQTQVLVELWQTAGLPARYSVYNSSHTTAEVLYDGAWHHLDSDEDALLLGLDNHTPAGSADVTADHYLANRSVFYGMIAATIPYEEVSRQINASLFTWPTGQAYPAAPQDAPSWSLLPGASLAWRWSNQGKHYSALQAGATGSGPPPSALYANGQLVYQPNLSINAGRLGLVAGTNVQDAQAGVPGLQPVDPTQPLSATWRLSVPWAMVGGQLQASITTASDNDSVSLSISRDGFNFDRLAVTSSSGSNQLVANLDSWLSPYTQWQGADRTIWIRLDSTPGDGLAWTLDQIQFALDLQMNPLSLPELTLGTNQVEFRDDTAGVHQVQVAQRWIERTGWTPPQAPGLLGPIGSTNANGLTFRWSTPSSVDGLMYYQLVVSEYPDMRWSLAPYFELISITNQWSITQPGMLNPGQTYYWRMRASSANGVWGPWSPTVSFTVNQPAAPTGLQLQPTADGLGYTLRWSPGAGGSAPVRYRVYGSNEKSFTPSDGDHPVLTGGGQVATVSDYQSKSVDLNRLDTWPGNLVATTTDTALVVAGPAAVAGANKYHWRVLAEDASGNRSTPTTFVSLPTPLISTQPASTTLASGAPFSYQPKVVTSDGQLSMLGNAMVAYWDGMRTSWKLIAPPAGLSIDPSTGAITGTPPIGLNPIHVQASVAWNQLTNYSLPTLPVQTATADQQFDLRVVGPPQIVTFSALPATITAGQSFDVTVTVTDAAKFGLSVPVTLVLEDPAGLASLAGTTTATAVNGTASFTGLSLTKAGLGYKLKATAGTATGESTAFALTAAAPAPVEATVVASPTSLTADGSAATTLTVTVRDAYRNPAAGVAASQVVLSANPATGVTLTQPTAATDANGQTTATARSTRAGAVALAAAVGAIALPQAATVTFTPGPPSAAQSDVAVTSASAVADGTATVAVTLTIRDANGNPVPNVAASLLQVAVSPSTGMTVTQPSAATDVNGQTTATIRGTRAGAVTVSATLSGATIGPNVSQAQLATFTAGPPVAANSTLTADVATQTADGTSAVTLTITARDANGNGVPGVAANLLQVAAAPATGVVLTAPTAVTDANGQTTAQATGTVATTVTFSGQLGGTALGSTAAVTYVPGPTNAAHSTASVPTSGTAGILIPFAVRARDAHDNLRTTGGDAIAATVSGANAGKPVAAKDNGDGTYTLSYTPTVAGTDTLAVTLGGAGISGSPFSRTVLVGTVMASASTLVADKATAQATGLDVVSFTITARDELGNGIYGLAASRFGLTVSNPTGVTLIQPTAPTDAAGRTTASAISVLASATPVLFGARFDGVNIALSGPVTFVPGPGSPAQSTASVPATGAAGSVTAVTVRTRDANGNPRVSGGETVAASLTGANAGKPVTTKDNADGTYTLSYTPTAVGSDTITVTLGGTAISGSPFASTVAPGPVSGGRTTASVAASGTAGILIPIGVVARDAYGNRLTTGGDPIAASVTGANAGKPVSAKDNGDGTYSLSYTPTVAGTDSLAVTIGGQSLGGSPYSRTVLVGTVMASTSSIAADKTTVQATGADVATFTITARDELGNPIPGLAASRFALTVSAPTGVTLVQPTAATDAAGRTTASATSVLASTTPVRFGVSFDGSNIAVSGAITVVPGPVSGSRSSASVPASGGAGLPVAIAVQARDASGNRLTSGGDPVAASVTGANGGKPVAAKDNGDGTYTLSYTPTVAGGDSLAITLGGQALGGSPYGRTVLVGTVMASTSSLVADKGTVQATGADVATFTITARDELGNPIPGLAASRFALTVSAPTGVTLVQPTAATDAAGRTTASATSVLATSTPVRFGASFDGANIALSGSITFMPGPGSPAQSTATVAAGTAGSVTGVTVKTRDVNGNARTSGGETVAASVTGANAGRTVTVKDNADGTYSLSYTPTAAGTDTVGITLSGVAIAGSPFASAVAPGPVSAARSTASLTASSTAGIPVPISVVARDAFGNRLTVGGDPVAGSVTGANAGKPVAAKDNGDGTYSLSYTPTVAGTDSLALTIGGAPLSGSPFSRTVLVGTVKASTSTLAPDKTTAQATGADAVTLTITARDELGNPIAGLAASRFAVTVSTPTGVTLVQPTTATDAAGRTTASATSVLASATPVQFGVRFDSVNVALSAPVTFVPGPGSPAQSTASVPAGTAGAVTTITVRTRDANGNLRISGGETVAGAVTGANAGKPLTVKDNADGTYSLSYTPTVAGTDTVAITLGGTALGGSPFASAVSPGPVSAAQSTASVPASGTAGILIPISLQARDASGNRRTVGGDPVAAAVTGANAGKPVAVKDNGDGTYTLSYTPTVAGSDSLALTIGGQPLGRSPFSRTVLVGTVMASASTLVADKSTAQATGTDPVALTITARDEFGNPIAGLAASRFSVTISNSTGVTLVQPTAATDAAGRTTATATSVLATATPVQFGVRFDSVNIALSGPVTFSPGAVSAAQSTAGVSPSGVAGFSVPITVQARDTAGNKLTTGGAAVAGSASGANAGKSVTVKDNGDGTYTLTYTPTVAGTDSLAVTLNGVAISGSPFSRTVLVGTVMASTSSLVADKTAAQATGTDPVTFTLTVRDEFSNPIPGLAASRLTLTVSDPTGVTLVQPTAATDAAGQTTASATSVTTSATAVQFGASFDGLNIALSGPITFGSGTLPAGRAVTHRSEGAFTLTLAKGWSKLGNPLDHDLPWDLSQITVLVAGQPQGTLADSRLWDTVRPYLWVDHAAQGRFEPVFPPYLQPTIAPSAGLWACALTDGVQLVVNATAARTQASGPRDWQLQLTAQQGDAPPAEMRVGAAAGLSRALPFDAPPEIAAGPLRLEVLQPNGGRAAGELRPGADGTWSWDLVVTVPQDGQVTLAWPNLLRSLPRGLTATLQDLTTGTAYLLNTHGSYRFAGTRGERRLRLACRSGHTDRAEITTFSAVQGRGRGLSVNLSLTGPAQVTLRVRGLGGRLVKELTSSGDVAGALTVSWDGTDRDGRPVPAGTYQLEATAVSADGGLSRAVRTVVVR